MVSRPAHGPDSQFANGDPLKASLDTAQHGVLMDARSCERIREDLRTRPLDLIGVPGEQCAPALNLCAPALNLVADRLPQEPFSLRTLIRAFNQVLDQPQELIATLPNGQEFLESSRIVASVNAEINSHGGRELLRPHIPEQIKALEATEAALSSMAPLLTLLADSTASIVRDHLPDILKNLVPAQYQDAMAEEIRGGARIELKEYFQTAQELADKVSSILDPDCKAYFSGFRHDQPHPLCAPPDYRFGQIQKTGAIALYVETDGICHIGLWTPLGKLDCHVVRPPLSDGQIDALIENLHLREIPFTKDTLPGFFQMLGQEARLFVITRDVSGNPLPQDVVVRSQGQLLSPDTAEALWAESRPEERVERFGACVVPLRLAAKEQRAADELASQAEIIRTKAGEVSGTMNAAEIAADLLSPAKDLEAAAYAVKAGVSALSDILPQVIAQSDNTEGQDYADVLRFESNLLSMLAALGPDSIPEIVNQSGLPFFENHYRPFLKAVGEEEALLRLDVCLRTGTTEQKMASLKLLDCLDLKSSYLIAECLTDLDESVVKRAVSMMEKRIERLPEFGAQVCQAIEKGLGESPGATHLYELARLLQKVAPEIPEVIPLLCRMVREHPERDSQWGVQALGDYGALAKGAIPTLEWARENGSQWVKTYAEEALARISLALRSA